MTEEQEKILDEGIESAGSILIETIKQAGIKNSLETNLLDADTGTIYTLKLVRVENSGNQQKIPMGGGGDA